MSNFKDFVKSNFKHKIVSTSSSNELASNIRSTLVSKSLGISSTKREKFSRELADMAYGDEVLTELSQAIGEPEENENEDEFVERAKLILSNILKKKLMK